MYINYWYFRAMPQPTYSGMTKYHKGPQRSITGSAAGNWHQMSSMVPYIPVRAKIFHMLPDLVENLRSLIASHTPSVDVEISFYVSVIRSIGSPSLTGRRCQSRSDSASGTLCSRWHAKALLHGTQQSTSTDGSLTVLHRPESRCWEETVKSSSTKCRLHKTRSKNFD